MPSNPELLVSDTNILMDGVKDDDQTDAPIEEIRAARLFLATLLSTQMQLAYSKGILAEWQAKGLWADDSVLRTLFDQGKLSERSPVRLSGGQRSELGKYVNFDDQQFVLVAASLEGKKKLLLTRDPKTTLKASKRYVKNKFSVQVLLASEFVSSAGA